MACDLQSAGKKKNRRINNDQNKTGGTFIPCKKIYRVYDPVAVAVEVAAAAVAVAAALVVLLDQVT